MTCADRVSVVGGGPSGLAAAITLAQAGVPVTLYERRRQVGGRFHGDFQGLENWTTGQDALDWLSGLGVNPVFPNRPVGEVTVVDPDLRATALHGERPLLYLVQRGPGDGSLDQTLGAQAAEAGVCLRFGEAVDPRSLSGPVIVATGPRETQAVVAGVLAETSHRDQVLAILQDDLAPRCYAYCIIWDGKATLATALATDFGTAWACLERARAAFSELGLSDFRNERRFGGRANVRWGRSLEDGPRWYVGEAAGLQDYFLGFGLRYAILSGHLAARALISGESYAGLVAGELLGSFRAGFVNRLVYNHLGDRGYRWLVRWVAEAQDVARRARRIYAFTPFHRALWPLARAAAGNENGRPQQDWRGGPRSD